MSKQLGVGVRVFVGWGPDHWIAPSYAFGDPRLKYGVISGGPFLPGEVHTDITGHQDTVGPIREWNVDLHDGSSVCATEDTLTPIDDDQESVTRLAELENAE